MNQDKKAKVILIPTEKSRIFKHDQDNSLYLFNEVREAIHSNQATPQQLLIISDDEIKDGDWYGSPNGIISQYKGKEILSKSWFKIIASYPPLIIANMQDSNAVRDINFDIEQPQLSQQFIEQYIESYNKGEVITDVLIEYIGNLKVNSYHENGDPNKSDSHYIFYPKINPDNTITIKQVKDSWSREEVKQLLIDCCGEVSCEDGILIGKTPVELLNWINKNL